MFLYFYFFFIVQLGLLMVRITDPWGVFLISTPFLCSLFPALKSPGCLLLFVIRCAISRAVLEGRGILANGHRSRSCQALGSPRNLGFIENSTRVCEERLAGAGGGTERVGLIHGCSWLHWFSALPSAPLHAALPSLARGWWWPRGLHPGSCPEALTIPKSCFIRIRRLP